MITATIIGSRTLSATVVVTGTAPGNRYQVEIITGTGGWNSPGKKLWVDGKIMINMEMAD